MVLCPRAGRLGSEWRLAWVARPLRRAQTEGGEQTRSYSVLRGVLLAESQRRVVNEAGDLLKWRHQRRLVDSSLVCSRVLGRRKLFRDDEACALHASGGAQRDDLRGGDVSNNRVWIMGKTSA